MRNLIRAACVLALVGLGPTVAAAQTSAQTGVPAGAAAAPKTAGEFFNKAFRQGMAGDNVGSRASLDQAIQLKPDFHLARLMRAQVLTDLGEYDAALADLDAIAPNLSRQEVLELKGQVYQRADRHREAIDTYKALVALNPNSADAHRQLGLARQSSEIDAEMPAALADYDRALKLNPDLLKIYALKGEILSYRKDAKGVDGNYQAWLSKAPNDPEVHAAYANALVRLGDEKRALVEIDKAVALAPSGENFLARAEIRPQDQRQAVLADFDRALTAAAKNRKDDTAFSAYRVYMARARQQARWKQFDAALADAELALKEKPDNRSALQLRYNLNQEVGRYALALKDIDALLVRAPNDATLLNERCWNRAIANVELDKAMADCEASLKLRPSGAPALDSRAFVRLRQGQFQAAVADYDAALKLEPRQAASLFGRGVAKRRLGDQAGGDKDIAAARKIASDIETRFAGYGVKP